ncbi:MAG: hypothetical protein ACFFBD_00285 [Candidatus Hodarchaeota archaeon]
MQIPPIDLVFILMTTISGIVTFFLALLILKKDWKDLVNRLFSSVFFALSFGMMILGISNFLIAELNLFVTKIGYSLVFSAAVLLLATAITLNYGSVIWQWHIILLFVGLIAFPFIFLIILIPNSMYFPDTLAADVNMSTEASLIYFPLLLLVGALTFWIFATLYRQSSGTVKRRFGLFIVGYSVTLIGGAVPDLIANLFADRFFDVLSAFLIALGSIIMYIGFNLKEKIGQEQ